MSEGSSPIRGVVRNGVVVLDPQAKLPEGAEVEVKLTPMEFTPEERTEFEAWDRLSDEAWAMIDQWEKEEQDEAG